MSKDVFTKSRIRKYFGKIREVAEMPNLIEVQKSSYDLFLNSGEGSEPIKGEGLRGAFESIFPITDFNETAVLEFVSYELEKPKYDLEECHQRDLTFGAPLKVKLRLIVFEIDEESQAKSVKGIKEQDVYMGDIPLMTPNGTFLVPVRKELLFPRCIDHLGYFLTTTKARRILLVKYFLLVVLFLIEALGLILSLMPKT